LDGQTPFIKVPVKHYESPREIERAKREEELLTLAEDEPKRP